MARSRETSVALGSVAGMRWTSGRRLRGRVDLTADSEFTLALLDQPWVWQQRVVTSLSFGAPAHVTQRSSHQIELPPALLADHGVPEGTESVRAILPLTRRPKRQLLDLHLTGPDGTAASLLLRASIASIQAEYLRRLVESSPAVKQVRDVLTPALFEAICLFTPRTWRRYAEEFGHNGTRRYLQEGLGLEVAKHDLDSWLTDLRPAAVALADALGESLSGESSSENVLLAVPLLEPRPESVTTVASIVGGYTAAVASLAHHEDNTLLAELADYGRRWEVLLECDVPLGRATTIAVTEDRPLLVGWRGGVDLEVRLGDARSTHLQMVADDRSLELVGEPEVVAADRSSIVLFEDVRATREFAAVYTSDSARPAVGRARVRLRPVAEIRMLTSAVLGLNLGAIVGVYSLPFSVGLLALLVTPTTFATSLLLVREPASLARRLLTMRKRCVLGAASVLWIIVAVQLVVHRGSL